jgi:hypothetical protein
MEHPPMQKKAVLDWPCPDQAPRLVSKLEICQHGNFSQSHFERIPDKPEAVEIGERAKRWWSNEWDLWFARLRRHLSKQASAPVEPPPAIEVPQPQSRPPTRRKLLPPGARRPRAETGAEV